MSSNLKSDSYLTNKCFIYFNESPLKMIKNTFDFMLKAFFVFKIFEFFLLILWSSIRNSLIRKIRLILKFLTTQSG